MQEAADTELLRQYAEQESEAAFAALVTRHVNLVYSAALRKAGTPDAAEEITQAVFIILARKARALRRETILAGWLYRTAQLTAANFLRTEIRRIRREQEAYMRSLSNEDGSRPGAAAADAWLQIGPLLEDAMERLNEKEHHAVVLRFFEKKSFQEIGRAFGGTENAAKKRVIRGLEKLRAFFAKRGVESTTEAIAAAISTSAVQAAPATLATAVTAIAIGNGAAASISTLTLIKGTLKIMAWAKAKMAVAVGMAVMVAAGTAAVAVNEFHSTPITLGNSYLKLYDGRNGRGHVLTIQPIGSGTLTSSNKVALIGDVQNLDGIPSDHRELADFNDKTVSAVYLLPKGRTVILFEHARFGGAQYRLVGTGKVETVPDFGRTSPVFSNKVSSVRWAPQ